MKVTIGVASVGRGGGGCAAFFFFFFFRMNGVARKYLRKCVEGYSSLGP